MQGTVSVPHAEIIIIHFVLCQLEDRILAAESRVSAVHVIECAREERSPVKSTVEFLFGFQVRSFHFDGRQVFLPDGGKFFLRLVEVPLWDFL